MVLKVRAIQKGTLKAVAFWSSLCLVSILPFFPPHSDPSFVGNLFHYFLFYHSCIFCREEQIIIFYLISHFSYKIAYHRYPCISFFLCLMIYPGNHSISVYKYLPCPFYYCCIILHNLFKNSPLYIYKVFSILQCNEE